MPNIEYHLDHLELLKSIKNDESTFFDLAPKSAPVAQIKRSMGVPITLRESGSRDQKRRQERGLIKMLIFE